MKLLHALTSSFALAVIAIASSFTSSAAIPTNYYKSIDGKAGAELKTAVSNCCVYSPQIDRIPDIYSALPESFKQTDIYPGTIYWWDMYSDIKTSSRLSFGTSEDRGGGGMNREHAFPKSWWGGTTDTPAYCDLNHLYPAKGEPNIAKSNWPLGEVATPTYSNGVTTVGYPVAGQGGGARQVFEPADIYKGDFARTYMYMVTRYQDLKWSTSYSWMMQQNTYPTLRQWSIDLLLKWSREDPVSQKEIDRNEAVYAIQGNRNPFIDFPELAEYIWGNKVGKTFSVADNSVTGDPVLESPTAQSALDFNELAVGQTATRQIRFTGHNLTGSLTVTLGGTDKGMFAISTKSIPAAVVNTVDGYVLTVTYKPSSVGTHTARISITDGGLPGSRRVELLGQAAEVPSLSRIVALDATDITDNSYVANWDAAPELVDYYILTRTIYTDGGATKEEYTTSDTSFLVVDVDSRESYNVKSWRLGYTSPASDEIYVEHAGVDNIITDTPCGWAPEPGGIRVICAEPLSDVCVYDLAGRLMTVVSRVASGDVINLYPGAYIIVANGQIKPMRVLVK